jgi:SAM-dependent methyltransferase
MPQVLEPVYQNQDYYEQIYLQSEDPWDYYSAAEQAKYGCMLETAKRFQPSPLRVLDAGCSLGFLTVQLADYAPYVYAFDIAKSAVERTRNRCNRINTSTRFEVEIGDAVRPHYEPASFDVIFLGDVIRNLPTEQDQHLAIRNMLRLLSDGGIMVLTDCMKCYRQKAYVSLVESEGGCIQERIYYHDRYWIKFRSLVKQLCRPEQERALLANAGLHRAFTKLGRLRGTSGSKHFGLVVRNKQEIVR